MGKLGPALFSSSYRSASVSISLISPLSRNANTPLSTLPKALNELYRSRAEKAGSTSGMASSTNPAVTRRTVQILKARFVACVAVTAWSLAYG